MEDQVNNHLQRLGDLRHVPRHRHCPLSRCPVVPVAELGVHTRVADLGDAVAALADDAAGHLVGDDARDLSNTKGK